ncbi:MAG TPA: hypothetical protein H9694_04645 [Firmicutes bacterium]|nr:hypothetical protein [Bacillota bacterium]
MEEWERKENPSEEPAVRRPRTPAALMAAVIGGTAVLLALLLFLILKPPEAEAEPPAPQGAVSGTQPGEGPSGAMLCVLGEWEGKLAVFAPNGISPQEVYDVYISTLPEEEQQKLEQGIPVYDEGTLAGLLEDYTS